MGNSASVVVRIGKDEYSILPLTADPSVARKAYRLTKLSGDQAVYDIRVDNYGPQCECMGFLRWNRPCKHIRKLQSAGLV